MQKVIKKVVLAFCSALLVAVLAIGLTGCDKSGNVKKAFENNGYEVQVVNSDSPLITFATAGLSDKQKEDLAKYELIYVNKTLTTNKGLVLKCGSSAEIKDFLTIDDGNGTVSTTLYDTAVENGAINGNCYLILGTTSDVRDIFKNA